MARQSEQEIRNSYGDIGKHIFIHPDATSIDYEELPAHVPVPTWARVLDEATRARRKNETMRPGIDASILNSWGWIAKRPDGKWTNVLSNPESAAAASYFAPDTTLDQSLGGVSNVKGAVKKLTKWFHKHSCGKKDSLFVKFFMNFHTECRCCVFYRGFATGVVASAVFQFLLWVF